MPRRNRSEMLSRTRACISVHACADRLLRLDHHREKPECEQRFVSLLADAQS